MNTNPETRELVIQEAQRRLRAGEPTQRAELAVKFGTSQRIVQDSIAIARDRNQLAERLVQGVTEARDWREFENAVVQGARKVPPLVLDDLLRRLADLRRSR